METAAIPMIITFVCLVPGVLGSMLITFKFTDRIETINKAVHLRDIFNADFIKEMFNSYEHYEEILDEAGGDSKRIKESFEKQIQKKISRFKIITVPLIIGKVIIVLSVLFLFVKYILIAYFSIRQGTVFHPTFYFEFEVLILFALMFCFEKIKKTVNNYYRVLIDKVNEL